MRGILGFIVVSFDFFFFFEVVSFDFLIKKKLLFHRMY